VDRGLGFLFVQHSPHCTRGQPDGIELAAFFVREIVVNPAPTSAKDALSSSAPKADHFPFTVAATQSVFDKPSEDWIVSYLRRSGNTIQ